MKQFLNPCLIHSPEYTTSGEDLNLIKKFLHLHHNFRDDVNQPKLYIFPNDSTRYLMPSKQRKWEANRA